MSAKQAGPARIILTLAVCGLLSGIGIAGIYVVTLPLIEANQEAALERAVLKVLDGASSSRAFIEKEGVLVQAPPKTKAAKVFAGYDKAGAFVGYAIQWQGSGFQDVIKLIYGYSPDRQRIVGLQVVDSRETPGLGDKIVRDQKFLANFLDLAVSPEVVATKKGKSAENEIDAISGATISSKAVVRIVNAGNSQWLQILNHSQSTVTDFGAAPAAAGSQLATVTVTAPTTGAIPEATSSAESASSPEGTPQGTTESTIDRTRGAGQ